MTRLRPRGTAIPVLLVTLGLAGGLLGGWLVGTWCLGVVLICESGLLVAVGLFRDDGARQPRPGVRTLDDVLEYQRRVG